MYPKPRPPPLEVSHWMEKDLTMRKVAANSRLMTNDMRQNIILSRQFFTNLLNLSYARHRRLGEHDFDKKMFLKNQYRKTETSMPALRPYIDKFTHGMNRATPSPLQSHRQGENSFLSTSTPSFFSRAGTKSDLRFDRRPRPVTRQIKTAEATDPQPEISAMKSPPPTTNPQSPTVRKMSRARLNILALPKGVRPKGTHVYPRQLVPSDGTDTAEEILAKVDDTSQVTSVPIQDIPPPERPKTIADDTRFQDLMGAFVQVHQREATKSRTFKSIVGSNPSLQDDEGNWKMAHPSATSRNAEIEHRRQMLAGKLHGRVDIFLIEVGA